MSANKIIIATYGFPPYLKSLGGSIRVLKLAEYLISNGHDVTVVCARTSHADTFGYDELLARINTIACNDPVATLASRMSGPSASGAARSAGSHCSFKGRVQQRLKALVLDAMVPDTGILVAHRMLQAIRQEVASATAPVTLITSGPPHSVHLIGNRLARQHDGLKWIMDYRDSWNGTSLFRKHNSLLQRLNLAMERRCLRAVHHLAYISSPMLPKAERIAGRALTHKATLISNGYDERLLQDAPPASAGCAGGADGGSLRIGYYGAVDHGPASYRDPGVVYRALLQFPEHEVQFVVHGPSTLEAAWAGRLGERLKDGGKLPHAQAIRSMFEMDVLLLLHTREEGADEVVTGKVFEYVATGRPIISIGPADMAVNALLKDDPSFHWVDHRDEVGLVALLRRLQVCCRIGGPQRSGQLIRSFSRTAQHEKFMDLIDSRR
jgi:Glycosyl transferase 4-like domain